MSTMTESMQNLLNDLPKPVARGAQVITDVFTLEMMLEVKGLPFEKQFQFWIGAYMALTSNMLGAINKEATDSIITFFQEEREK
jgi:hypothetical protein